MEVTNILFCLVLTAACACCAFEENDNDNLLNIPASTRERRDHEAYRPPARASTPQPKNLNFRIYKVPKQAKGSDIVKLIRQENPSKTTPVLVLRQKSTKKPEVAKLNTENIINNQLRPEKRSDNDSETRMVKINTIDTEKNTTKAKLETSVEKYKDKKLDEKPDPVTIIQNDPVQLNQVKNTQTKPKKMGVNKVTEPEMKNENITKISSTEPDSKKDESDAIDLTNEYSLMTHVHDHEINPFIELKPVLKEVTEDKPLHEQKVMKTVESKSPPNKTIMENVRKPDVTKINMDKLHVKDLGEEIKTDDKLKLDSNADKLPAQNKTDEADGKIQKNKQAVTNMHPKTVLETKNISGAKKIAFKPIVDAIVKPAKVTNKNVPIDADTMKANVKLINEGTNSKEVPSKEIPASQKQNITKTDDVTEKKDSKADIKDLIIEKLKPPRVIEPKPNNAVSEKIATKLENDTEETVTIRKNDVVETIDRYKYPVNSDYNKKSNNIDSIVKDSNSVGNYAVNTQSKDSNTYSSNDCIMNNIDYEYSQPYQNGMVCANCGAFQSPNTFYYNQGLYPYNSVVSTPYDQTYENNAYSYTSQPMVSYKPVNFNDQGSKYDGYNVVPIMSYENCNAQANNDYITQSYLNSQNRNFKDQNNYLANQCYGYNCGIRPNKKVVKNNPTTYHQYKEKITPGKFVDRIFRSWNNMDITFKNRKAPVKIEFGKNAKSNRKNKT